MAATDRKTKILDAVILLLAEKGLDGVTHRAVDAAAGLPEGSTSYHFPRKAMLISEAADHLATLLGKECEDLQVGFAEHASAEGLDKAIDYVGNELVDYADTTRHLFLARVELTLASARSDELAGVGDRLTEAARRPIAFFLKLICDGRSDQQIDVCAGLIDGITLMYVTGQGPKLSTNQIKAVFAAVI